MKKILIADIVDVSVITSYSNKGIKIDYKPEITKEELYKEIKNYDALLVRSRTKVDNDLLNCRNNIKIVGKVGSGVDNIDLTACASKDIIVSNSPGANSCSVAELTVGLTISFLRKIPQAHQSMVAGQWLKKELIGTELAGKTVGIIGYGHIGQIVEKLLKAFNANILIYSRHNANTSLKALLAQSDIMTIHMPLTPETKSLLDEKRLNSLKSTAFIINTSRGELINEKALFNLLFNHKIAGAAIDVYWQEPLVSDSPWRKLDNVILLPHIGASTKEALKKGTAIVLTDVINVLKGKDSLNCIN